MVLNRVKDFTKRLDIGYDWCDSFRDKRGYVCRNRANTRRYLKKVAHRDVRRSEMFHIADSLVA